MARTDYILFLTNIYCDLVTQIMSNNNNKSHLLLENQSQKKEK